MLALSARAKILRPSATIALDTRAKAMKRAGVPVISLAVGEPDMDTPAGITEAAVLALRAGATRYVDPAGIPELRAAIREKMRRDQGLEYAAEQVCVTSGAKQALFNAILALASPGDEILIPAPYWVSYPEMVRLADGVPVAVRWTEGFQIDLDDLARKVTPRTRLLLLNTPSNPTGAVYSRRALERLGELVLKHDLTVISDEIYEKLMYGGARHLSIAALSPELARRTVVVNGCSKAYAMTGWRLGYAAGPEEVIQAMTAIQSQSTSCVAPFVQHAAVAALRSGDAHVAPMVAEFDRRRIALLARVRAWPGTKAAEPQGAFFVFPDVSRLLSAQVPDDLTLSALLLEEAKVAMVPGTPFGAPGHLRISYAAPLDQLGHACDAVEGVLRRLAR